MDINGSIFLCQILRFESNPCASVRIIGVACMPLVFKLLVCSDHPYRSIAQSLTLPMRIHSFIVSYTDPPTPFSPTKMV